MLAALLAANLGWTTLCLGGYRPETMIVTSLLTGAALIAWLIGWGWGSLPPVQRLGGAFLPFLAYAAVNAAAITPTPWLGWHDWLWVAQWVAVFWIVLNGVRSPAPRAALLAILGVLAVVAVALGAYQRFVRPDWLMLGRVQADQFLGRASGSFGIPNSLGALLILLLPLALALSLRRGATAVQRLLFGYLALVVAFGLVLTVSRGAWLALGIAVAGWPLISLRRNWRWRVGAMAGALLGMILVAGVLVETVPLVRARFAAMAAESGEWTRPIMWRGAWRLFEAHPWLGSGAGSYNVLFEGFRPENYQMEPQWAHNDYLNTLSDYGLVGFVLLFGAMGVVAGVSVARFRRANRVGTASDGWTDPLIDQGLAVGLGAFLLQLFVDFHLKIPALAMAFAVVAAIAVGRQGEGRGARRGAPSPRSRFAQGAGLLGAGLVLLALMAWVVPHYRAEALRYGARQSLDILWRVDESAGEYGSVLSGARQRLQDAVEIDPRNAQAWADLAYAEVLASRLHPSRASQSGQAAERMADRALHLNAMAIEGWIRRAVARDVQGRWFEAGDDLQRAMQLSPNSAIVWYFYAYHMSLRPTGLEQARAAVELCLRLDPGYQAAQLLRQKLATNH